MSFFEPLPAPEPPEEEPPQPAWFGPPEGVLGGVVADQLALVRTDELFVAVTHISVYPTGVAFQLSGALRSPTQRFPSVGFPGEEEPARALRLGVLYPDGRRAQTPSGRPWPDSGEPADPVLMGRGGGSGGRSWHQDHWLWPAPPEGDLTFVLAWPAQEVPETRATLRADLIADARRRIVEAWPGPPPGRSTA